MIFCPSVVNSRALNTCRKEISDFLPLMSSGHLVRDAKTIKVLFKYLIFELCAVVGSYDDDKRLKKDSDSLREEVARATRKIAYTQNIIPQPSFNQKYMQQPMPDPKDITDPTTAMNMTLALMAKAFKLNYSTPTNNNQRISSNPRNRQISQLGMNMGQDRQMQMVGGNGGNQFRQYVGHNVGNQNGYNAVQNVRNQVVQNVVHNPKVQNVRNKNGLIVVSRIVNQNPNGNGNLVAARVEGNVTGNNAYLDEIEEVNANCILIVNLQQASTSGNQTDKAHVYDSDGSGEYTELLEPIPEPHKVPQNANNVISEVSSMEQSGGTVEQCTANVEETSVLYDSLYNNLAIKVEKVITVNRKLRETNAELTTELARYKNQDKCFEIS
nr:hypothetical protein [Tanacetum cinerariifolium]